MEPHERIIVALDVADSGSALHLAGRLFGKVGLVKVGSRLFTHEGPSIIKSLRDNGSKVFLDLKFHDIPSTVMAAVASGDATGAKMMTLHLCGGGEMLQAARLAAGDQSPITIAYGIPLLLGVTVLTSFTLETLHSVGISGEIEQQVLRLAQIGFESGLRGFVASPQEIVPLRKRFGKEITIVTPGVRPDWAVVNDQKRVMTPRQAVEAGADYLVIGRPITADADPRQAAKRIIKELEAN